MFGVVNYLNIYHLLSYHFILFDVLNPFSLQLDFLFVILGVKDTFFPKMNLFVNTTYYK